MKGKSKDDNSDVLLVGKDNSSKNSKILNLTTMKWDDPSDIVEDYADKGYSIDAEAFIEYVSKVQSEPSSVKVSIPLDSINLKRKSSILNGENSALEAKAKGDSSPHSENSLENKFKELFNANKAENIDIESDRSDKNEKSLELYDCDQFLISSEDTSKLCENVTPTTTSSSGASYDGQSVSTVELHYSDQESYQFDYKTKTEIEKAEVEKYMQSYEFHEEISDHSDEEVLSDLVLQDNRSAKLKQTNSSSSVTSSRTVLIDDDELDYEPADDEDSLLEEEGDSQNQSSTENVTSSKVDENEQKPEVAIEHKNHPSIEISSIADHNHSFFEDDIMTQNESSAENVTKSIVDNEDKLNPKPAVEQKCQSPVEISPIAVPNCSLRKDVFRTCNVKWDTQEVLNKLVEKDENLDVTEPKKNLPEKSVTCSGNLSESSDEIELEPDCNDILYEEYSNQSADTTPRSVNKVNSNFAITMPTNAKKNLVESVKCGIASGLFKNSLQQIEDSADSASIAKALELVIAADEKPADIMPEIFKVYRNVFKYIEPRKKHSDILNKLILLNKEHKDLGNLLRGLFEFIDCKPGFIYLRYDTCEVLLESAIKQTAWPTVVKMLEYSMIKCRNKPHANCIKAVVKVLGKFPHLCKSIVKLIEIGCKKDQHFTTYFEQKVKEDFYQLLKSYKNDDAETIGDLLFQRCHSAVNILDRRGLIAPNPALQTLTTPQSISLQTCTQYYNDPNISVKNLILNENWEELGFIANRAIEFGYNDDINSIFCALRNHHNPSQAYTKFLSTLQWKQQGNIMRSHQVTLLGQIGTCLFLDQFHQRQYEAAMQIIKTLHTYNLNYYHLQKKPVFDSLSVKVISANEVAFTAVSVAIQVENPFFGIQILNDCNWIGLSENEHVPMNEEQLNQREEIFHSLIVLIIKIISSNRLQNPVELLSEGLKVLIMFTKINSIKSNIEDLFNKYFALLLNMEMYDECVELDTVFQNPQPTLQRGFLLLNKKQQRSTKFLLQQLTLEGVYLKNNILERVVNLSSHYTDEEFEVLLSNFLDRLFEFSTRNMKGNYQIQIVLEHCGSNLENPFGIKSLLCTTDLEGGFNRLSNILDQLGLDIIRPYSGPSKYSIIITDKSVHKYLIKNYKHLGKPLPSFISNQKHPFSNKVGVIKGIKKLDPPTITRNPPPPRPPSSVRPSSVLKRRLGDQRSISLDLKQKAIITVQKKDKLKEFNNFQITSNFMPKSPPLPIRFNSTSERFAHHSENISSCQIADAVRIKIENFLKSKLCSAKKDPSQSKDLTNAFIQFIVNKLQLSSITTLQASLLKELNSFAVDKIKL